MKLTGFFYLIMMLTFRRLITLFVSYQYICVQKGQYFSKKRSLILNIIEY